MLLIVSMIGNRRGREKKKQTNKNGSWFENIFLWKIKKKNILGWALVWGFNMSLKSILSDCRQFHQKKKKSLKPEKMFSLENFEPF